MYSGDKLELAVQIERTGYLIENNPKQINTVHKFRNLIHRNHVHTDEKKFDEVYVCKYYSSHCYIS